jgi:corrinoid protein of di/trimethylamine methyltransferase
MDMSSKDDILDGLKDAVVEGDEEKCVPFANKALDSGVDPYEAIMQGCGAGMAVCSDLYDKGEVFVPEILLSAEAMYAAMDVLKPHLKEKAAGMAEVKGGVVIGVVEGDMHDIGKNLVKIMLDAAGFTIYDLGRDVQLESFVNTVKEHNAEVLCLSTLMTTTMVGMQEVIALLKEQGLRDNVKVLIGGAPITPDFTTRIGADAYGEDASKAVRIAERLVKELRGSA